MKKTLLISTLVAASTASVWADVATLDKWSNGTPSSLNTDTHSYSSSAHKYGSWFEDGWYGDVAEVAKNPTTSVSNNKDSMSIDLTQNARYEFKFEVTSTAGQDWAHPTVNIYLSGSNKSVLFGNYYLNYSYGSAGVGIYTGPVSGGNTVGGSNTYLLNSELNSTPGAVYVSPSGSTLLGGAKFAQGTHTYRITIESYSDSDKDDVIMFYYNGAGGEIKREMTLKELGFGNSAYFDSFGFFTFADAGSSVKVTSAQGYKYNRAENPPVEPTPDQPIVPDVPEPSAFGLLAGLGAIALGVSRRRRFRV